MRNLKTEIVSLVFTPVNFHGEVYARPYVFGLPDHAIAAIEETHDQLNDQEPGEEHLLIASEVADFVTVSPSHLGQPVGLPDGMSAPRCSFILTVRSVFLDGMECAVFEYHGHTSKINELTFEALKEAYLFVDNYRAYSGNRESLRGAGNMIHAGAPSQGAETIARACDIFAKMDVHDFMNQNNMIDTRTMLIPGHRFVTDCLSWVPSRMAHDLGMTMLQSAHDLGLLVDPDDGADEQSASDELEDIISKGETPGELAEGKDNSITDQYSMSDVYTHCRGRTSQPVARVVGTKNSSQEGVLTIEKLLTDYDISEADLIARTTTLLAPKIDQSYTLGWERTSMHSYLAWLISNVTFGYAQYLGANKLWFTLQKDEDGSQEMILVEYLDFKGNGTKEDHKYFETAIKEELFPVIEKLFKETGVEIQVHYDRDDLIVKIDDIQFTRPNWMSSMYAPVLSTSEIDKRNHPAIEQFLNKLVDESQLQVQ